MKLQHFADLFDKALNAAATVRIYRLNGPV